jgi:dTMP kinase
MTGKSKGAFVTLEGVDGAGKSTHVQWLVDELTSRGLHVVSTREPGGTPLGEQLRQMVLNQSMTLETETLLMFAARCEHIRDVIQPALDAGHWVVCDRFTDATYAYQGGGRGMDKARIQALEQWVQGDLQPDRTWLFDVPLSVARERLDRGLPLDRFEKEDETFFGRTRDAYLGRTVAQPGRFRVVDSTRSIEDIRAEISSQLDELVAEFSGCPTP